jgi:hypothetical protein
MLLLLCFSILADLAREISKELPDVKVDFLRASSYGTASESSGQVQVKTTSDLGRWEEYHILLVSGCQALCFLMYVYLCAMALPVSHRGRCRSRPPATCADGKNASNCWRAMGQGWCKHASAEQTHRVKVQTTSGLGLWGDGYITTFCCNITTFCCIEGLTTHHIFIAVAHNG